MGNQRDTVFHDVAALRELDRRAIAALDGDSYALMRKAAAAALWRLRARWPEARRLAVCCGRGNNAGDGYVLARLALAAGLAPVVYNCAPDAVGTVDARRARAEFIDVGGSESVFAPGADFADAQMLVDALFGIGLSRAPDVPDAALIDAMNASGLPVLALDLPSGLSADTGDALGTVVRADLTVTFISHKAGLMTGRGPDLSGELVLEALEVSDEIHAAVPASGERLGVGLLRGLIRPRRPGAHKGDSGHVLAIGGDHGYGGAIRLAAEAALRSGAGLVSVATRAEHVPGFIAARPELMARGTADVAALVPLLRRATVLVLGPGLGRGAWSLQLLDAALDAGLPAVLDADALNLISDAARALPPGCVLTPHPGEAARLLGRDVPTIEQDRLAAARSLANRYGAVTVLKGAGSVIAAPDGRVAIAPFAEPALASGGTGDVLSGVIGALMAQGLGAWDAARAGVVAHALAGRAAGRGGTRGTLASDVIAALRAVLNP